MEECSACHRTFEAWTLKDINLGRRHKYLCQECYKKGRTQVQYAEYVNKKIANAVKEKHQ